MREQIKTIGAVLHSTIITTAFSATCLALYYREIPISQRDIALVLLGALISEMKGVGSYWTGSTASSQSKDATIANIATKGPTT
jgi:hypothetical protein